jgi:hypothetical protein
MFIAVMDFDADRRLKKYQGDFATLAEAQAHVDRMSSDYPNAFAAPDPGGGWFDWIVNPAGTALQASLRVRPARRDNRVVQAIRRLAREAGIEAEIYSILDG